MDTSSMPQLAILVFFFLLFYFVFIRPENKKKKRTEEIRKNISIGDEVITIGGMTGTVVEVSGDNLTFETGEDRVRINIMKWGISTTKGLLEAEAKAREQKKGGR